ncbi:unnamed protein product [Ectocarpus sp. 13 AM-2016]
MHSLKELRAENAAKRLSSDRTAEDAHGTSSPAAVPTATPATAAPRAGRTLAPIGSTGSLPPSDATGPTRPTAGDDDAQQREDREARRRRRLRRRREREQRENAGGDDNSKVSVDDNTTVVSGTSQTSTPRVDEDEEGGSTPTARGKGAPLEGRAGRGSEREKSEQVGAGPPRSRHPPAAAAPFVAEEKVAGDDKKVDPEENGSELEKPLSARGAPPKEKPKKKLTPLEARRARIEQQKREEVERTSGGSIESPRSGGANLPRETPEAKGDAKSRGQAERANSRIDSDRGDSTRDTGSRNNNRTGQATARGSPQTGGRGSGVERNVGMEGTPAVQSGNDVGGSGTEHDPLIPEGRTSERKPRNGDDVVTRKQPEAAQVEKKAEREAVQTAGDADGVGTAAPGDNANDPLEGAAGGDGGRFRGMRSRMKQAGKGLMTKKSPASSVRGGKEAENQAISETTRRKDEQPGTMGRTSSGTTRGTSSGDTLSDTEGEGEKEKAGKAGDEDNSLIEAGGVQNTPENRGDDSDTASDTEDQDEFDADRNEGGQERKKKWTRSKDKSLADAPLTGDKEVTLGHVVDRKMREMGYIRKPAVNQLKNRRSLRDRVAAERAPEVHFIGEISGAEGFGSGISCRFRVEGGRHWTCLAGLEEGQTHVMHMDYGDTFAPWNHPVDLHYTTKSIQGWPRMMLQVWQLDTHGRNVLRGYGFRHLPSTPGFSEVSVPCWRPSGSMQEETAAFFLGVTPRLTAEDAVFNRAWDQRCRLITLPAGTVWLQMHGLFRNLEDQGVDNI